jgi:hypothetical protein
MIARRWGVIRRPRALGCAQKDPREDTGLSVVSINL